MTTGILDAWWDRLEGLSSDQLDDLIQKQDEWFLFAEDDDLGDDMAEALQGTRKQKINFIMTSVKSLDTLGKVEFLESELNR